MPDASAARRFQGLEGAGAAAPALLNAQSRRERIARKRGPHGNEDDGAEADIEDDAHGGGKPPRSVRSRSAEDRPAEQESPALDAGQTWIDDRHRSEVLRYRDAADSALGNGLDIDPSASGQGRDGRKDGRSLPPDEETEKQRLGGRHTGHVETSVQRRIALDLGGRPSVTVRADRDMDGRAAAVRQTGDEAALPRRPARP